VDISKLFLWKKEYIIKDKNGVPIRDEEGNPVIVFIRIIGDNDSDEAKKYALRYSKKLRTKYRENKIEVIPDLSGMTVEELASLQVLNEASLLYKQAERETEIEYPKDVNDLFLEDQERYAEEIDTYFERLITAIDNNAKDLLEKQKQYYMGIDKESLRIKVENSYINKIIEGDMAKVYTDAIMHFAVYNDIECTEKTFKSIDEVLNASSILKEQLYAEYASLALRDIELKK